VRLPRVEIGDLVAIRRAGAYGCTMGMLAFLGHRTPAEVLVDGGKDRVIRRRSGFEETLFNIPPLR
jgi:diaminopimelate decarboxylase